MADESDEEKAVAELELKLDSINSQLLEMLRSVEPEMQKVGDLLVSMYEVFGKQLAELSDAASEQIDVHNKLVILNRDVTLATTSYLDGLEKRVSALENKVGQPHRELEEIKTKLAEQQSFIEEHRPTLVELAAIRANKFLKWVQSLSDKEKRKND